MPATRLMRLFNEQLDAIAKLNKKTGRQKVTVEHVHVHSGILFVSVRLRGIAAQPAG
jgi:hypothetical protein